MSHTHVAWPAHAHTTPSRTLHFGHGARRCRQLAAAVADCAPRNPCTHTLPLVAAHYDSWRKENPQYMAFFYAPWCGHCKNAKPFYGKASTKISIPMVAMDCTGTGKATCDANDVSGFPTIKYFDGEETTDYSGSRDEAGFVGFLKKKDPNYEVE